LFVFYDSLTHAKLLVNSPPTLDKRKRWQMLSLLRISSLKGPSLINGWSKCSSWQKSSLATAEGLIVSPCKRGTEIIIQDKAFAVTQKYENDFMTFNYFRNSPDTVSWIHQGLKFANNCYSRDSCLQMVCSTPSFKF